jgi:putative ABC transport system permease protein
MDTLLHDLRFALRTLAKRPGFTLVVVLTLMLGIGATTALFSVVNAVLLRPLPYPAADRLVVLWARRGAETGRLIAIPDVLEWRARNHTLEDIGIARTQSVNLTGIDTPDRLIGNFVTASTLRLLGAHAAVGRLFTPEETALGSAQRVAVLSDGVWKTRFGRDPHIIGRSLVLNGRPHVVIGVMAPEFRDAFGPNDVWLPITSAPDSAWFTRADPEVWAIGRLRPGVSATAAERDLSAIAARLAAEYPETNAGIGAEVRSLTDTLVGNVRPRLLLLFGFAGVLLLIACANVANLELARSAARVRELEVRVALGAGARRLVRQLLTESLVLAAAGGVAGVAFASWAIRGLTAVVASDLPVVGAIGLEPRVLAFSALITVLTGLVFGAAPALQAARRPPGNALKQRAGERVRPGGRRLDAQHTFVIAELALAVVLLVCTGLLVRSVLALQRVRPGFDPRGLLTAEFRLPAAKYRTPEAITDFMSRALAELRAVPGVRSAALVRSVPLSGNWGRAAYIPDTHPELTTASASAAQLNAVSDGFFRTMGIPLLAGRDFDEHDRAGAPPVVIVNEELARRAWPNRPALGRRIRLLDGSDEWATIVGVVGTVTQLTLAEPPAPQVYVPMAQAPAIFASVVVRTGSDPMAFAPAIRRSIWAVDRDQPVWKLRSMDALVARDVAGPGTTMQLAAAFALVALLLAAVGVYGVMSFAVAQRTHEVGVRMALGAHESQVVRLVVQRGMRVVGVAIGLGLVVSLGAVQPLRGRLFRVTTTDPVTLLVAPAVLAGVALLACWIPARRAARVDPMVALRDE